MGLELGWEALGLAGCPRSHPGTGQQAPWALASSHDPPESSPLSYMRWPHMRGFNKVWRSVWPTFFQLSVKSQHTDRLTFADIVIYFQLTKKHCINKCTMSAPC